MSRCSIIIPVHGRAGLTARCLDALLAAPEPAVREIIVVDDASPDHTAGVLAAYGAAIRVERLERNGGFAAACNRGAAVADGDLLLFLNNDVLPRPGWLAEMVAHLDAHPRAAAAGAKLLYPDGTVQHAGVVFGQDGHPRHIYSGFPAAHPAVNRSRPYQAVTAACMLIRRSAFRGAGGFDTAYRNGLEDVDLCLRLGAAGHEVHYCHRSVLQHLESVSRGRRSPDIQAGIRRFQERWGTRIRPDDLDHYIRDGLLEIAYDDLYPLRLTVSPLLAALEDGARTKTVERQLIRRSRQVADLLRDLVDMTAQAADRKRPAAGFPRDDDGRSPAAGHLDDGEEIDHRLLDIEMRLLGLQEAIAGNRAAGDAFTPSPGLAYRRLVARVRSLVEEAIPHGATVAVISGGDDELLELDGRRAWHYPRTEGGRFAGHYPVDGVAAIAHLDELRADGARFLVVPITSSWWLREYPELGRRLADRTLLAERAGVAAVYDLGAARPAVATTLGGNP